MRPSYDFVRTLAFPPHKKRYASLFVLSASLPLHSPFRGTTYGIGDGVSTFNVPDLSGRVVLGVSQSHALGSTGGEANHVLTEQELPAHSHTVPSHGHANDITATTPVLTHTITQPEYRYNKPNTKGTQTSYGVNNYVSVNTLTATRSTDLVINSHDAEDCTVSGGLGNSDLVVTGQTGGSAAHSNMQPYVAINYVISTGVV